MYNLFPMATSHAGIAEHVQQRQKLLKPLDSTLCLFGNVLWSLVKIGEVLKFTRWLVKVSSYFIVVWIFILIEKSREKSEKIE